MSASDAVATVVLEGLHFGESPLVGPDGRVYLSDFYARQVLALQPGSWSQEVVATVPEQPSGLGWLDPERLLIVSMCDRQLLRREPDGRLYTHADLSAVAVGAANDMHVDAAGRAWVGDFGFDFYGLLQQDPTADPLFGPGADPPHAHLTTVDPAGQVTPVAGGLRFPNGIVQLSQGTLVVAETAGMCLTAFTPESEGRVGERWVWADLSAAGADGGAILPDGICADAEDAIWVSDPTHTRAARLTADGVVDHVVHTRRPCFAVGLVQHTLVCCTADSSNPHLAGSRRSGCIETASVQVPAPSG